MAVEGGKKGSSVCDINKTNIAKRQASRQTDKQTERHAQTDRRLTRTRGTF